MDSRCPACQTDRAETKEVNLGPGKRLECRCRRCGDFSLELTLADGLRGEPYSQLLDSLLDNDVQKIAVLSHWIRTSNESITKESQGGELPYVVLNKELVASIIKNPRPSLAEQADNLVRWLGDKTKAGGDRIFCSEVTIQAIVGAATTAEFLLVFNHLKSQGIITGERQIDKSSAATGTQIGATLSFSGVQRYLELKRATPSSRRAFMAMEYNHPDLDELLRDVLKPAVRQTGFDLFVLSERPKAGLIDNRLRVEIQTSRFLIADLTHENAGAYWEAGYAEGLGKPVIYTCEKSKFETCKTHFDTNHHLTLQWDSNGSTEIAEDLKATIRATLPAEAKLTDD